MDTELLKKIVETPGAPGFEGPIRSLLYDLLKPFADEIYTDRMNNLIVRLHGKGPKVMFAAHMDEISLITTHADDKGFVRFSTLGGFDSETLISQRVHIHGKETVPGIIGSKPVHLQNENDKKSKTKLKDLFIDTGLGKKAKKIIPDGSPVTRINELSELGSFYTAKSLDNRISVYMLAEALRQRPKPNADIYAVFTVQEEVGLRGARVAAQAIQPDIGIAMDVTLANDLPGISEHEMCTKLGKGIGIKVMDKSIICTPALVSWLENLASSHKIKHQREVLTVGGTDTSAMQYLMGIASHVTSISCPLRYIHSTVETCAKTDVEAGIELAVATIQSIGDYSIE